MRAYTLQSDIKGEGQQFDGDLEECLEQDY